MTSRLLYRYYCGLDATVYDQSRTIHQVESGHDQNELEKRRNAHRKALAQWHACLECAVGAVLPNLEA